MPNTKDNDKGRKSEAEFDSKNPDQKSPSGRGRGQTSRRDPASIGGGRTKGTRGDNQKDREGDNEKR